MYEPLMHKEKLLIFHFNDTELKKIKQIAINQKIQFRLVDDLEYGKTLEQIANSAAPAAGLATAGGAVSGATNTPMSGVIGNEPSATGVPEESMLVLCDFSEKRMDKLLAALRKSQVQVDYKAILTPTNRKWNVMRLLLEMRTEKAAYEKQQKE